MPLCPHAAAQCDSSGDSPGNAKATGNVFQDLLAQDPPLSLSVICARIHARVQAFLDAAPADERVRAAQKQSRESLQIIGEALNRYRFDELSLSYNGGKDCLVLLILYLAALHIRAQRPNDSSEGTDVAGITTTPLPDALPSVYIISPHPFPEIDAFVDASSRAYRLALTRYDKPMKEAFQAYLAVHTEVRAIFVGTRRTDPHGAQLEPFAATDRGWPEFMRIHPVLDWHYADIWLFIRHLGVPYCELYDHGYTSLGGTLDTHPNPALQDDARGAGGAGGSYRPAYELMTDEEERLGRDR